MRYHDCLSQEEQRAAGVATPAAYALADRVRFNEIDALGHANNAAYTVWYETARVRYLRHHGLTSFGPDEPRLVIFRAEIDYLAELFAEQDYVITCRCVGFRTSSFTLENELWAGGRLCSRFRGIMVAMYPDGSGKMPLPDSFLKVFEGIDGAVSAT
ncbi:acyl-CoA thioesterase [Marivivens marinus]|uniref:acyl-CoA thioesterase n=1 Tax=Marivivens marinus TaxID=3110173 RepID=UPI003B84B299